MEEAEYCHRLILMNRGTVVATDTPSGLRASMTEPIFRVGGVDAPKLVERLSDAPGIVDAALFGRDLHVVVSGGEPGRATIEGALPESDRTRAQVEAIEPSLEDVFVSLIRREGGAPL
jgi:ABC-2 type transport system ATP-binding protein